MSHQMAVIGKFDALHRGHHALAMAAGQYGQPVLVSFSGMAEELGWEQRAPLTAPSQRSQVLSKWSASMPASMSGSVAEQVLPFAQVRRLDPVAFITFLLEEYGFAGIACGEDFRFGFQRRGGVDDLRRESELRGFTLQVVPPVLHDGAPISSSRVRSAVTNGDVELVHALLDRPYRLVGQVTRGAGRGRQLGFPTANLSALENCLPAVGVYAAVAQVHDQQVLTAVNVGYAPSVASGRELVVEAHLIDWSGDCYGQVVTLDLMGRVRGEQRFDGVEALIRQISADVATIRDRFALG